MSRAVSDAEKIAKSHLEWTKKLGRHEVDSDVPDTLAKALLTAIEALEDLRDAPEAHIGTVVAARRALSAIRGEEKGANDA